MARLFDIPIQGESKSMSLDNDCGLSTQIALCPWRTKTGAYGRCLHELLSSDDVRVGRTSLGELHVL